MIEMNEVFRIRLHRLTVWCQQSINRRIFIATATAGAFTGLAHLAAIVKELVVAHQFGTGDALDAFLIAFLLPSSIMNIVAGSFNAALIPTYIQVRDREGWESAQKLLSNIFIGSSGLLIILSILLVVTAPFVLPLLGAGFNKEKLALTQSLFFIMLPILLLSGLAKIGGAVLNAGERFAMVAVSPLMTYSAAIVVLLWAGKTWGIYALAIGTVIGFALEGGFLLWGLHRRGHPLVFRWNGFDAVTVQVIRQFVPVVAGSLLMGSTTLIDQTMATLLDPGSVAALNYGSRVTGVLIGLAATALGTAVIPFFSQQVARRDLDGVRSTFHGYLRFIFLVTLPITGLLFAFSEPVVKFLFQKGSFTAHDTLVVTQVQAYYALQIPFYIAGTLVVRLISSLRANHALLWGAAINMPMNIALNYLFMKKMGVAGIALSTSCVYLISFSFLYYYWHGWLREG